MKSFIIFNLFVVACLFSGCQSVFHGQSTWPYEESDLDPDPAVTWGSLENGFRYAVLPNVEPPERVSLRLLVNAGSLNEDDDQRGLAHFLEHMAFNGTKNYKPGEMVKYFQRLGMSFGADTNAHTGFDETVYKLELPNGSAEMLEEGLRLLRDYGDGMLLLDEEINKERGVILAEKRDRDSVGLRTYVADISFNLPDSIMPYRLPIGTEDVIANAPTERFRDFYKKWYTSDRMALVAVGNIDPEELATLADKYFSSLEAPEERVKDPDLGVIKPSGLVAMLHTEVEAPVTTVSIQTNARYFPVIDTKERRKVKLIRKVASSMLSRRLEILAKQESAPFTEGVGYIYEALDFVCSAGIELTCKPQQWDLALQTAEQELRKVLEYGFTQAELVEVKAHILNAFQQAAKGAPTRHSRALANKLTSDISNETIFISPKQGLDMYAPMLEKLTVEDCLEVFREFWQTENVSLFVSGNLSLEDAETQILNAYNKSKKKVLTPSEEKDSQVWEYTDFGSSGEVLKKTEHYDLGVVQVEFENNVRLNIKKTDYKKNSIGVTVRVGGGELDAFKAKSGIVDFTESTFIAGGLGKYSVDDLVSMFAGKNISVSMNITEDAIVFSGGTTPEDLALEMQYICAFITDPGYREESLRQFKKEVEELYISLDHTINGVMQNEVAHFLAGGDKRFGFPEKEVLLSVGLEDSRNWLADPLSKGYMEISIVGDLDVETVIAIVSETFGALPDRDADKPNYSDARKLVFPLGSDRQVFNYNTEIPKAIAAIYFPTVDGWDISRARRLNMLSQIFSDRLRIKVREDLGDAYSPFAGNKSSYTYDDYGYFFSAIVVDPAMIDGVVSAISEIAKELSLNGVSQDELDRALKPLLESLKQSVRNNAYWSEVVLSSSQEYPERLEFARTRSKDYASISKKDIDELAKMYLKPDRGVEIVIIPVAGK